MAGDSHPRRILRTGGQVLGRGRAAGSSLELGIPRLLTPMCWQPSPAPT